MNLSLLGKFLGEQEVWIDVLVEKYGLGLWILVTKEQSVTTRKSLISYIYLREINNGTIESNWNYV